MPITSTPDNSQTEDFNMTPPLDKYIDDCEQNEIPRDLQYTVDGTDTQPSRFTDCNLTDLNITPPNCLVSLQNRYHYILICKYLKYKYYSL